MPTKQNNSGFGYLPVLIISALVISGTYFGYNWYNNQNITVKESDDVLAGVTPAKTAPKTPTKPAPVFNIENKPVLWKSYNQENQNDIKVVWHFVGKDTKKLNDLVENIKSRKVVYFVPGKKVNTPCTVGGVPYVSKTLEPTVVKLAPDYVIVYVDKLQSIFQNNKYALCGLGNSPDPKFYYTILPGLDEQYIFITQTDMKKSNLFADPMQYWLSIQDSSSSTGTASQKGISGAANVKPAVKPLNVPSNLIDGFKPSIN